MACDFVPLSGINGAILQGVAVLSAAPNSMLVWFKPSQMQDAALCVLNRGTGYVDAEHFTLETRVDGTIIALETGHIGDNSDNAVAGTYTTGTWQTAGAVFASDSSRTAYFNGVRGTTNTGHGSIWVIDQTQIGGRRLYSNSIFRPFYGCLAHIAIWNIALSDSDMALLSDGAHLPTDIQPAHLVLYVPLVDEATDTVTQAWDPISETFVDGITLAEFGIGSINTCSTSPTIVVPPPVIPTEPPAHSPTPTPDVPLNYEARQLKPYERPPIVQYRVGDPKTKFPVPFFVFDDGDLRVTIDQIETTAFSFAGKGVAFPGWDDADAIVADLDYLVKQASVPGFQGGIVTLNTAVEDCIVTIWLDTPPTRGAVADSGLRRDLDTSEFNGRIGGYQFADLWATYRAQHLKFSRKPTVAFTGAHIVTAAECGQLFEGSVLTLPAATTGLHVDLIGGSAVRAGSDTIRNGSATTGTTLTAGSPIATAHLICVKRGSWFVASKNGSWALA